MNKIDYNSRTSLSPRTYFHSPQNNNYLPLRYKQDGINTRGSLIKKIANSSESKLKFSESYRRKQC